MRIPPLGLGTWDLRGDACRRAVREALELGYRHVDTAQMYENETDVGRGLAAASVDRDEVFVTTKLWRDNLTCDAVSKSTEASLKLRSARLVARLGLIRSFGMLERVNDTSLRMNLA